MTKRNGSRVDWFGYDGTFDVPWDIPSLLWSNGENLYDETNNSHITLDTPRAMDLLQWYADMRWQDKSAPTPAEQKLYTTIGFSNFQSSKGALAYNCSWFIKFMSDVMKDPWSLVAVPKGPDGKRRSWVTSDAMVLTSDSQSKDGGWELLKFASSVEYETLLMKYNLLQPARTALIPQWLGNVKAYLKDAHPDFADRINAEAYIAAYDYSPTAQPHFSDHAKAMEILQPVWDQIYATGTAKVKDVIPAAVKAANDALKDVPSTIIK
jgi:ABC-type glycerol-3-phosphate transport system substrate-binding protein